METGEIWIGIIIPLIIGPISAYLMTLRNDYIERKYRRNRERYEEERDTIFNSLKNFYWPVYLNLLCIQQYSYSLPIKNKFRYESNSSINLSSESNDFYINDSDDENSTEKKKYSLVKQNKPNINEIDLDNIIKDLNENNDSISSGSDNVEITIPINNFENNEIKQNIHMDIKKRKFSKQFTNFKRDSKKTIILDKLTVKNFEANLNKKYNETINIIEQNMALICIHQKLNIHVIDFIKFVKMREIIHEGSIDRQYTLEYFGVKNNLDEFLYEIHIILSNLNDKYIELLKKPI
jgi:hypothetical protein